MDQEPNPYRDPSDPATPGAPAPRSPGWKVPRAAVTVGLAAFLGMAGAGVAFAVSGPSGSTTSSTGSSGSSTTTPGPTTPGRHGMGGFGFRGGPGAMMGGPGVVHGTFTVKNGTGYRTEQVQVGSVQAGNTPTSITVKSADGYSQTYAVQPSTVVNSQAGGISTVKSGDEVRVMALQQGSGWTASDIVDTSQINSSRQGFGFAPPAMPTPPAPPGGTGSDSGSAA